MSFVLPDRTYEGTVIHGDEYAPEVFIKTLTAFLVFESIGVAVGCMLLVPVIYALVTHWKRKNKKRQHNIHSLIALLSIVIFYITVCVFIIIKVLAMDGWKVCNWLVLCPSVYMLHMSTVYYLFLRRAEAVNVGSSGKHVKLYTRALRFAKMMMLSTPGMAIIAFFFAQGKLFFKEGYCVEVTAAWLGYAFMGLNVFISLFMLSLFLYPVYVTIYRNVDNPKNKIIKKVALRNLIITLIGVVTTTIAIIAQMVLVNSYYENPNLEDSFYAFAPYFCGWPDITINTILVLYLYHTLWVPNFVLKRLGISTDPSTTDNKSSTTTSSALTSRKTSKCNKIDMGKSMALSKNTVDVINSQCTTNVSVVSDIVYDGLDSNYHIIDTV